MPAEDEYEYDCFLSFRRLDGWPTWVRDEFLPIFKHWVTDELGEDLRVFVDNQSEEATDWPRELGRAHASSRILIPLLTGTYFSSAWCTSEYELMQWRGTATANAHVIAPAIISDGQYLPEEIHRAYPCMLKEHVAIRMATGSAMAERLETAIKEWAPRVVKAIKNAPPHDPSWEDEAVKAMDKAYAASPVLTHKPVWAT